jgi:hypothetical protein
VTGIPELRSQFTQRRPHQHHVVASSGVFLEGGGAADFVVGMSEDRENVHPLSIKNPRTWRGSDYAVGFNAK